MSSRARNYHLFDHWVVWPHTYCSTASAHSSPLPPSSPPLPRPHKPQHWELLLNLQCLVTLGVLTPSMWLWWRWLYVSASCEQLSRYHFPQLCWSAGMRVFRSDPQLGPEHLPLRFHSVVMSRLLWPPMRSNEGQNIRNSILFNVYVTIEQFFWLSSISFWYKNEIVKIVV